MTNQTIIKYFKKYNFNINVFKRDISIDNSLTLLSKKNILVISGCELTYMINYLKHYNINIDHTFINKTSSDPFSEINNKDSLLFKEKYDFIIISQVQMIRSYINKIFQLSVNNSIDEFIDELIKQLKYFMENVPQNCPIYYFTYPIKNINIVGINEYKYMHKPINLVNEINNNIYKLSIQYSNLYILDFNLSIEKFGLNDKIIRYEHQGGHPEPFSGLLIGEYFIKQVYSSSPNIPRIKCIVVDLDNTLWEGIYREDGENGIKMYKNRIDMLYLLSNRGIILCICSKNDEDDSENIKNILKNNCIGLYRKIVLYKINWNPKSINIKSIAEELNIGLDSIAFFDDQEFERNEVKTSLPMIKTYTDNDLLYAHESIYFQPIDGILTNDSRNRSEVYKSNIIREKDAIEHNNITFTEYLKSIQLKLTINRSKMGEIDRIFEIIQRTNQQNVTMKRYTKTELNILMNDEKYGIYSLYLEDKFGDYGHIGVIILYIHNNRTNIIEYALSCKAMGKKVEEAIIIFIINISYEFGMKDIYIDIKETDKNRNIVKMFNEIGFNDGVYNILSKIEYPEWFIIDYIS